jgi:hypothetical protein
VSANVVAGVCFPALESAFISVHLRFLSESLRQSFAQSPPENFSQNPLDPDAGLR